VRFFIGVTARLIESESEPVSVGNAVTEPSPLGCLSGEVARKLPDPDSTFAGSGRKPFARRLKLWVVESGVFFTWANEPD
jgi:hypothetical protein